MTTLTERTYGLDYTDDRGWGYVQRDAVSAAAAVRQLRRDYPVVSVEHVEVVYTPPAAS